MPPTKELIFVGFAWVLAHYLVSKSYFGCGISIKAVVFLDGKNLVECLSRNSVVNRRVLAKGQIVYKAMSRIRVLRVKWLALKPRYC